MTGNLKETEVHFKPWLKG